MISRHADVDALLRDDRFGVATPSPWREVIAQGAPPSMRMLSENMLLFVDPPQHTRIRGLVSQAFTPRRVEALRPRLTEMIDAMLDELAAAPTFDVIDAVAGPFPIMAISELLDLPPGEAPRLRDWTLAMTAPDEIPMNFESLPAAGRAADEFLAYANTLIDHRRAHPGDDLISAFIAAEDGGEQLTHDELLGLIVLLLVAGHETTMSLVSTALLLLLQRPDVAAEVRDDPAVAPAVVEETLRFMGPLQVASGGGRWPFEPVTMYDHTMQPGERVRLLLGAANRDERGVHRPRHVRPAPQQQPARRLRQGPALLRRCRARPARGSGRDPRGAAPIPRARARRRDAELAARLRDASARRVARDHRLTRRPPSIVR